MLSLLSSIALWATATAQSSKCMTFATYAPNSNCATFQEEHINIAENACTIVGTRSIKMTGSNGYQIYSDTACTTTLVTSSTTAVECKQSNYFDIFFGVASLDCPTNTQECKLFVPDAFYIGLNFDYTTPLNAQTFKPVIRGMNIGGSALCANHDAQGAALTTTFCVKTSAGANDDMECRPNNVVVHAKTNSPHGYRCSYSDNKYGNTFLASDPYVYANTEVATLNTPSQMSSNFPIPWLSTNCY